MVYKDPSERGSMKRALHVRFNEDEWELFYHLAALMTESERRWISQREVVVKAVRMAIERYEEGDE